MVQALAEAGALEGTKGSYRLAAPTAELVLPPTVQAVLSARIDRLGERAKEILQTAAVVGREFAEPVLRRVASLPAEELSAALAALAEGEFVYASAVYPEAEYAFKHPLTQEVAYRSQLAERRRRVHAAVAAALEELRAAKLDEASGLIAHHREAAGEPRVAARWHRRAAGWLGARERSQTLLHWRAVCELLGREPESPDGVALALEARAQIIFNIAAIGHRAEEDIERRFAEGRELAARLGRPSAAIPLHASYALSRFYAGALTEAVEVSERARRLVDDSTPPLLRLRLAGPTYFILVQAGRLRDARSLQQEVAALEEELNLQGDPHFGAEMFGFSPRAMLGATRALHLIMEGRIGEAIPTLDGALAIAAPRHDTEVLLAGHRVGLLMAELLDDAPLAIRHTREIAVLGDASASRVVQAHSAMMAGCALLLGGEPGRAITQLREALAMARQFHVLLQGEALLVARLAEALRRAGRPDEALAVAREAVAVARRQGALVSQMEALAALARVLRSAGETADAAGALDEAWALVERTGARAYEPFLRLERAALAELRGEEGTRRRELREAQRLFVAMGATRRAEAAGRALA